MQDNSHPTAPLFSALTKALQDGELEQAQDLLKELTSILQSTPAEELGENITYFSALNEQLLEAIKTLEGEKGLAKDQLSQYRVNTKKLKAYTK